MQSRRSCSHWRLLLAAPRSGAENMARDTALLARAARTGETVFSIYSWQRPTLSFGRHQPATGHYDLDKIHAAKIDIVRRPTGGRAILHHHEVTYSVTAPLGGAHLRAAYSRINRLLLDGLSRLGVAAALPSPSGHAPAPGARSCFEIAGEGELIADGRKLVGSAQYRDEAALLQHGSILVEDDQCLLPTFSSSASSLRAHAAPEPATLASIMGRAPDVKEVASAMFDAVKALEDSGATAIGENEIREETLRHVSHFLDEGWTWRR